MCQILPSFHDGDVKRHFARQITLPASLFLAAGLLLAPNGHAQTALGNGRGLEADLSGRGVGNTPRPDFMNEVRMRNDLVTGNAVGGRSFRGSVGYRSGDEFRGLLGSDELFSFRRDSVGGGAAGLGLRGTSSLQYQYSYSTANQFSAPSSLSRSGGATDMNKVELSSRLSTPRRVESNRTTNFGDGWNALAPRMGTLRSTSTFNSIAGLNPVVLGSRETRDGLESLTASSLLGLRTVLTRREGVPGALPPGATNQAANPQSATPATANGLSTSTRPEGNNEVRTSYAQVASRLRTASGKLPLASAGRVPAEGAAEGNISGEAGGDPLDAAWETRLNTLRAQLETASRQREEQLLRENIRRKITGAKPALTQDAMISQDKGLEEEKPGRLVDAFDAATLEMLRQAAGEVGSYTETVVDRDLYSGYMVKGTAALAAGKYFDAEEQFARALSISPGDPMASAARLNSQLGGSLFLSAALNLEALLLKHPELATTRYTGSAVPSRKRLDDIVILLRERIANDVKIGASPPRDASLLLAYVGYQINDGGMVSEGLAALAASNRTPASPDALLALLKVVWAS